MRSRTFTEDLEKLGARRTLEERVFASARSYHLLFNVRYSWVLTFCPFRETAMWVCASFRDKGTSFVL